MNPTSLIAVTLFVQTFAIILSGGGFLMVSREYLRRRQPHLIAYALGLLAMAVAYVALFTGELLSAFDDTVLAMRLMVGFQQCLVVAALAIGIGAALLYLPKKFFLPVATALAGSSVVAFVYTGFFMEYDVIVRGGFTFPLVSSSDFAYSFFPLLGAALLHLCAFASKDGTRLSRSADQLLGAVGALQFLVFMVRFLYVSAYNPVFLPISTILQISIMFCLVFGAIAKQNPDPRIAESPHMFFRKRLLYKAAGFNALLFWFLTFFLILVMSAYFVRSAVENLRVGLRKDAHFFSKSFAASGVQFLEETQNLALLPSLPLLITRNDGQLPPAVRDFVNKDGNQRILRVVDNEGVVVFSSFAPEEVGTLFDSRVMRKALSGERVSATEHEGAANMWAMRAAVPLTFPDGTDGGVVLTTDLSTGLDFSAYMAIAPLNATGYGYVTPTGFIGFSSGTQIDELTKDKVRQTLGVGTAASVRFDSSSDEVFAEHTYATDGEHNGFFYAILGGEQVTRFVFRIMSVVMIMIVLALGVVGTIAVFALSMALRPIKSLHTAAARVARDDYGARVAYESPDEIGELASAFNRMGAAIEDRSNRLERSVREQQDFIEHSILDLRTPINVFRWTLELMRFGDTGRLTHQQMEFLEQMHQTNERLARMLQSLQDVSRLDRGRFPLDIQRFAIEDVIDEAAGELVVRLREKNIALHWAKPHPAMPFIQADRSVTKKVLINILSNAVKYNRQGGHVEISLDPSEGGGKFVKVSIEDSGMGITEEDRPRVFDRFFRSSDVVRAEVEGNGLGLHITKRLVELMGGRIWFTSAVSKGTTFHVTFPLETFRLKHDE